MKTKAICITLLTFLFFVKANWHSCICPEPASEAIGKSLIIASMNAQVEDFCSDCGHTKTCCFDQQDQEMTGTDAGLVGEQIKVTAELGPRSQVLDFPQTALPQDRFVNKAPPPCLLQTPISLHQKLLV